MERFFNTAGPQKPDIYYTIDPLAGDIRDTVQNEGHLIVFNREGQLSWDERIWHRPMEHQGRTIMVWGM